MSNPRLLSGTHLMNAQVACAEGALAAGVDLFVGYPITPATEISERLAIRMPQVGAIYLQGADELDSLAIVIGSVWGGFKAMTATSGNGICLMQENIGYAAMTETPCVIVDMMRAGPGTGIATKSAQGDVYQIRYGSNSDYAIIALAPDSPQEMFDLTVEAFNLSEKYRVPTFILGDEILAHLREKVIIPSDVTLIDRRTPNESPSDSYQTWAVPGGEMIPSLPSFGQGYHLAVSSFARMPDGSPSQAYLVHKQLVERLWNKIEANTDEIIKIETEMVEDADVIVICYGTVSRSARSAIRQARQEGIKAGLLRLITLWPFPDSMIQTVCKNAKKIIVAEMNIGKIKREVDRCLGRFLDPVLMAKPGVELHKPIEVLREIRKLT